MASRGKHTIVEEIRLTGGAELEKELSQLGDAGKKAFAELKKAADDAGKTTALSKFLNQLNKDLVGIQKQAKVTVASYRELGSATQSFARNITALSAVVLGAGAGLLAFVKKSADAADEQNKAAQSTGTAIDEYGKLQFAFEQGNVDAATFGTGLKKLNQNIDQAAKGSGAGADLFKRLGISVKDANGNILPTSAILEAIANKFQSLPDGAAKSALAIQLFGKSGAALIPVLDDGGKAMAELSAQAEKLGLVFTKQEAVIGDNFGDALNVLTRQAVATSEHLGLLFAPAFTDLFKGLSDILAANKNAIIAFGQTLATQVGPVVKDFLNILSGNDSAVVNKNLLGVRDTVVAIGQALGIVANIVNTVFTQLVELVRPFVEIINEAFGTKFTAQAVVISGIILALTGSFRVLGLGITALKESWLLAVKIFGSSAGLVSAVFVGILAAIATVQNAIDDIGFGFQQAGAAAVTTFTAVQSFFTEFGTFLTNIWTGLTTNTGTLFTDMAKAITSAFQSVFDFISDGVKTLLSPLQGLIDLATKAAAAVAGAFGGGGGGSSDTSSGGGGFAGGGHVTGPGTPTSDSILARLSDGEFVVKAAAVRKYGVNALAMLNGMRLPSLGFAHGGLVSGSGGMAGLLPSFASGGPVGRPVTLVMPTGDSFDLTADENVAGKMVRYATTRVVRSAGRRPTWSN